MENIDEVFINRDDSKKKIYKLVDMHGGGDLIPWMRYAMQSGDESFIDGYIETTIKDFMYNGGKGKLEAISELVKMRNKERNERLSAFSRKKGKGKAQPNILEDFNQEGNQGDLMKALKLLDGGKGGKGDAKYREIIWKIDERGTMGENLVGCCLMQGSPVHKQIAMKLINAFPKLVNDIMLSEEYYGNFSRAWDKKLGLSPLHQAIVNEDPHLVSFLLQHGAEVNQRCYGAFFCPDDQKASRTDSLEHEYVDLSAKTNYQGRMYLGEYPLSYAASIDQMDCYKLLRANKADPNLKDTNGNTVLHMTVIHERLEMLKFAYDTGAKLNIPNKQNLTPLTLAAKMAKKRMFEEILQLESNINWNYGEALSMAYPLAKIDTINEETGDLNEDSALSLVVYGETEEHLELLEGLLEDVLDAKWDSFGKKKWFINAIGFTIYWILLCLAFTSRPFSKTTNVELDDQSYFLPYNRENHECSYRFVDAMLINKSRLHDEFDTCSSLYPNITCALDPSSVERCKFVKQDDQCHLIYYFDYGYQGYIRLICEPAVWFCAAYQIVVELLNIHSIGRKKWFRVISSFPEKILYEVSLALVLLVPITRGMCLLNINTAGDFWLFCDNLLSIMTVISATMHFLFYCRSIKFVGPFIFMIYKIITVDLVRFFLIYIIFLVGFSQGFYIVFLSCARANFISIFDQCNKTGFDFDHNDCSNTSDYKIWAMKQAREDNIMDNPLESIMRCFIMTIGEFMELYKGLSVCKAPITAVMGKIMFIVYMLLVFCMQFNLLIAMLTRTYETIYGTQREYKRQWAQVILLLELALSPKDRLMALLKYSRPIGTNKKKRAFVVTRKNDNLTETEKMIREQQIIQLREEKHAFLKRRLKDITHSMAKYAHATKEIRIPNPT